MSQIQLSQSVGQLVAERPELSRVFEELQIDYCCHGSSTLQEACQRHNLDPANVLTKLAPKELAESDRRDWLTAPLGELCDHIVQTHHAFLRTELPRLDQLTAKVADVHGDKHPELLNVTTVFQALQAELLPHMMKEEQILFPAIRLLETSEHPVQLPFGTVGNPIRMMEHEHEVAGDALAQLRSATNGYQVPEDACNTYRAMLDGLRELELDLHQHIHKENNILFPRALSQEAALGSDRCR